MRAQRKHLRSSRNVFRQDVCAPSNWRVFCAIELPEEVCARATEHINRLRRAFPNVNASWNRDGKFHVTLKFLGRVPPARVEKLSHAADLATKGLSPFPVFVEGAGVFPKHGPPKVLWIGISDSANRLNELYECLEDECAKEAFTQEQRPFHPHLTLARLRKQQGARTIAAEHKQMQFESMKVIVSALLVIRSQLSSEGSKYAVISRHVLGAPSTTKSATGGAALGEDCRLNASRQFRQTLP